VAAIRTYPRKLPRYGKLEPAICEVAPSFPPDGFMASRSFPWREVAHRWWEIVGSPKRRSPASGNFRLSSPAVMMAFVRNLSKKLIWESSRLLPEGWSDVGRFLFLGCHGSENVPLRSRIDCVRNGRTRALMRISAAWWFIWARSHGCSGRLVGRSRSSHSEHLQWVRAMELGERPFLFFAGRSEITEASERVSGRRLRQVATPAEWTPFLYFLREALWKSGKPNFGPRVPVGVMFPLEEGVAGKLWLPCFGCSQGFGKPPSFRQDKGSTPPFPVVMVSFRHCP
jgi:hypothetical protein